MSIQSVTSAATTGVGALSGLLLVSPQNTVGYQPQKVGSTDALGKAIIFHYEGEQKSRLESDITDHYVEDNTAINDNIALKPETITTRGFIGELNDVPPNAVLAAAQVIANKLTVLSPYVPELPLSALIAYNEASFLYATAASAIDAGVQTLGAVDNFAFGNNGQAVINSNGLVPTDSPQNKQQTYYQLFYGYWKKRTLFTVQTPWAVYQNMAILSMESIQDADTRMITDFNITFKAMRFSSTIVLPGQTPVAAGRAANARDPLVDHGASNTKAPVAQRFG